MSIFGASFRTLPVLAALTVLAFALVPVSTHAQAAGEEPADTRAIVVTPLSLVKDTDLDFGLIIPGTTQGFVTMNPNGTVTTTGGVVQVVGETQPAAFYGLGQFRQFLRISIDANQYQLRRVGGTQTMRLDQIRIGSTPPTSLSTTPRLFYIGSADGFFRFTVGGRLRVGANQMPGTYQAEFNVTVEYL